MYTFSLTPSGMCIKSKATELVLDFSLKTLLSNDKIVGFEFIGKIDKLTDLLILTELFMREDLYSKFIIEKVRFIGGLGILVPCHVNVSLSALNNKNFIEVLSEKHDTDIQLEINDIYEYHSNIALKHTMGNLTKIGTKFWLDDFNLERKHLLELTTWYGIKIDAELINNKNIYEIVQLSKIYKIAIFNYIHSKHKNLEKYFEFYRQFKNKQLDLIEIISSGRMEIH